LLPEPNCFLLHPVEASARVFLLSRTERYVAELFARGFSVEEIMADLGGVLRQTIDNHACMICKKLETTRIGIARVWFCHLFDQERENVGK
jgi:DNA-binding NarL/FixJ family response regulator